MTTHPIITELENRIASELKAIDCEQAYRDMLDETCEQVTVGGLTFSPSRVIEELDPVAFRCGVSDYFANGEYVEVGGETYRHDDAEEVKAALVEELESELEEAQTSLDGSPDNGNDDGDVVRLNREIDEVNAKLAALESHSF